ncbi:MAG: TolC family protein [Kiritimatiellae bacterium]|jgi:outer membrane protein TolC|nr:TolC family protein [Kiritimatiellia bacterium]
MPSLVSSKIRWLAKGVCLFGLWPCAAGVESISLSDAIEVAVDHNFDLATSRIQQNFPQFQLHIAEADFRWKVTPTVAVERDSRRETVTRMEGRVEKRFSQGALFQVRAERVERDRSDAREGVELRVEQPLFRRFGALANLRDVHAAEFQLLMAQWGFQRETEALIMRVVEVYTAALNQERRMQQEMQALVRASDLVRLVEVRERQGRATGVDVLEMKMLHRQAELRFRRVEEGLNQSRAELAELLGRVSDQLPELEVVEETEWTRPTVVEAEELAREHRVERIQALAGYEEARRYLRLQERELYPDVRLIGSYRPESLNDEESWFTGISAGQQLDPHITRLQVEQEEQRVRAAMLRIASVEVRLSREVRQVYSQVETLEQERGIADAQLTLSRERLRLARGLYPSGRTTAAQLRESEEEWVRAQTEKTDVLLRQVRARYQFWYVLGLLVGESGSQ